MYADARQEVPASAGTARGLSCGNSTSQHHMSDEDWKITYPLGSTWRFSWTEDYVVTVTGHTRRGIQVNYKKPGAKHTLKKGIYQPDELVKAK